MEQIEDIRLSLDDIGEALKRFTSENKEESQSVKDFHSKVVSIFPQIYYESTESLWDDEPEEETSFTPLWWDDLDEPFELDEYHWLIRFQKLEILSAEKTIEMMTAIEAGVLAEAALAGEMYGDLLKKYGYEKMRKVVQLGEKASEEMISRNLKLVLHIARKYARKVDLEDAFSYGVFGLLQAVKKFDWRLGNQFSTYATWWLRQSMTREIADSSTTIDIPVHAVDKVNIYKREFREYLENEYTSAGDLTIKDKNGNIKGKVPSLPVPEFNPEMDSTLFFALEASAPAYDFWEVFNEARWLLEKYETPDLSVADFEFSGIAKDLSTRLTDFVLSSRELDVLLSRHGAVNGEPQTLEEIGNRLGFTRERSRQIEKKAILKLNVFLEGVTIGNYWEKIEEATRVYERKIQEDASLKLPTITRDECGQEAGYRQHRMKHEEPCQACKRAHRIEKTIYESSRPKPEKSKGSYTHNAEVLQATNKERSVKAAANQAEEVRWALEVLKHHTITKPMWAAAQARLQNPEASLSELAKILGEAVTKDMVAGNLRRLIKTAVTFSKERPPDIS
jgi:RNA polymerase sigma factor (sigma-70 family)